LNSDCCMRLRDFDLVKRIMDRNRKIDLLLVNTKKRADFCINKL